MSDEPTDSPTSTGTSSSSSSAEGASPLPMRCMDWVRCFTLAAIQIFALGIVTGYQGFFTRGLEEQGLFSSRCTFNATTNQSFPCHAQKAAIASAIDAAPSTLNIISVFAGAAADIFGGRKVAIFSSGVWLLGTAIQGIGAPDGIGFVLGSNLNAAASMTIYLAMAVSHFPQAVRRDEQRTAVLFAVNTALWDASGCLAIFLGYFLAFMGRDLYAASWAIYAAAVGIPMILALVYFDHGNEPVDDEQNAAVEKEKLDRIMELTANRDGESTRLVDPAALSVGTTTNGSTTVPEITGGPAAAVQQQQQQHKQRDANGAAPPTLLEMFRCQAASTLRIIHPHRSQYPRLWICICFNLCFTVTFGYFLLSNIGRFLESLHASPETVREFRQYIIYCVGASAIVGAGPGFLIETMRPISRALSWAALGEAMLLAITLILALSSSDVAVQRVMLAVFACWRAAAFVVTNSGIICLWRHIEPAGVGGAMGLSLSMAGVLSLILGGAATRAVQDNTDVFRPTLLAFGIVGIALLLWLAAEFRNIVKKEKHLTALKEVQQNSHCQPSQQFSETQSYVKDQKEDSAAGGVPSDISLKRI